MDKELKYALVELNHFGEGEYGKFKIVLDNLTADDITNIKYGAEEFEMGRNKFETKKKTKISRQKYNSIKNKKADYVLGSKINLKLYQCSDLWSQTDRIIPMFSKDDF